MQQAPETTKIVEAMNGRPAARTGPAVGLAIGLTVFFGAFLLFAVQPLIGKFILPWFGGSPAVWTTCLLFFQLILLAGYAYAHLLLRFASPRWQAIIHIAVLLVAAALLPIIPADRWKPSAGGGEPISQILILLSITAGLPYFVLSTTGPLMQGWFSRLRPGASPYRLYSLSNAASLLALLSYPFVVEPMLSRRMQAIGWSVAFGGFVIFGAACAAMLLRARTTDRAADPSDSFDCGGCSFPGAGALWLALPACASLLLMAVTNKICQDIAVVPFLWILPLGIYLLSFIICFDNPRWYVRPIFLALMLIGIAAICWTTLQHDGGVGIRAQIAIYCATLSACCMVCHGELYRLRPSPKHLTAYYLTIAAGGAVGGLLVALAAPALLNSYAELQFGLGGMLLMTAAVLYLDPSSPLHRGRHFFVWIGAWLTITLFVAALWVSAGQSGADIGAVILQRTRNFYGVLQVSERLVDEPIRRQRMLHHGGVEHGLQFILPQRRATPTAYYTINSGVGLLFRSIPKDKPCRVGMIGLGVGTVAAYARTGDEFRAYEINPDVVRLANEQFTFLADSAAPVELVLGDGRLSLEREPASRQFDILVLDAFSGDAIPVHLLTEQAVELYLRHLDADGAIAVHISNYHIDLLPVVIQLAKRFDLRLARFLNDADPANGVDGAQWVIMTRRTPASVLDAPLLRDTAIPLVPAGKTPPPLWTDDYTSLAPLLR